MEYDLGLAIPLIALDVHLSKVLLLELWLEKSLLLLLLLLHILPLLRVLN